MWQRFTERTRRVIFYAQEEAARQHVEYVGTEHLLLGLIREDDSVAARILQRLGVNPDQLRQEVERQVALGQDELGLEMQLTHDAKCVIDLAYEEARRLRNKHLGTEHLLLGLIRQEKAIAAEVLARVGVDLERARREIVALQNDKPRGRSPRPNAGGMGSEEFADDVPDAAYRPALDALLSVARETGTEDDLRAALQDLLEELDRPAPE